MEYEKGCRKTAFFILSDHIGDALHNSANGINSYKSLISDAFWLRSLCCHHNCGAGTYCAAYYKSAGDILGKACFLGML